jgi:energy-coupling factor transporter ATP-binding protein EcfA2
MLSDVRNYYGLARDFGQAGYFETEHSEQIVNELKLEIKAGKLVALSGIVGCGKTTMLRRIQEALSQKRGGTRHRRHLGARSFSPPAFWVENMNRDHQAGTSGIARILVLCPLSVSSGMTFSGRLV